VHGFLVTRTRLLSHGGLTDLQLLTCIDSNQADESVPSFIKEHRHMPLDDNFRQQLTPEQLQPITYFISMPTDNYSVPVLQLIINCPLSISPSLSLSISPSL
jgi:hypothetical protein